MTFSKYVKTFDPGVQIWPARGHMFHRGPSRENMKKTFLSEPTRARALIFGMQKIFVCGGGRVLLCAQRLYYRRDQLDCPPPNCLNHYLSLNKTGAYSTGERFRATLALLFIS